jgi:hypothetical protein
MHNWHVHIIFGTTSSCFEFWWFNYFMVINVVFKFGRPCESWRTLETFRLKHLKISRTNITAMDRRIKKKYHRELKTVFTLNFLPYKPTGAFWSYLMHNWHVHIIFGTSSCFEFWWFNYFMVINVVFKFGPVEITRIDGRPVNIWTYQLCIR